MDSNTCKFCNRTFPYTINLRRHEILNPNGKCADNIDTGSLPSRNVTIPRGVPSVGTSLADDPLPPAVSDADADDADDDEVISVEADSEEVEEENQETIDKLVWSTLSTIKGISLRDQQSILDMMIEVDEVKDRTGLRCSLSTVEKFSAYTQKMVKSMEPNLISPNKEGLVTVTSADVPDMGLEVFQAQYFYEDMDHFLRLEFGNSDHMGQFVLHASKKEDENGNRIKSYKHVAYLPKMSKNQLKVNPSTWRLVKLSAYSKILTAVLATMKQKSHHGVKLRDPWGQEQMVFVRLCSYVVDNPEIADMWCTKQGSTRFPCEICLCPSQHLGNYEASFPLRTERFCIEQLETYKELPQGQKSKYLTEHSFHPIPSGLWGFAEGNTDAGSSSWAFSSDGLHNDDLGVFLYIIAHAPILPHILYDIDEDMTRLACLWIHAYKIRHRKGYNPHITEDVLASIDHSIEAFMSLFMSTLGPHMKSGGRTVKMHKLLHVSTLIRRLGRTENFNSNFFESDHKNVKRDYKKTSKRTTTFLREMVNKGRERQASALLVQEHQPTSRVTSYVRASKSGNHELGNTAKRVNVSFDVLEGTSTEMTSPALSLLSLQPELVAEKLCGKLKVLLQEEGFAASPCISVAKSCTLCSLPSWSEEGAHDFYELHTIRATNDVCKKPWFDSIRVQGRDTHDQAVIWYAQVRLLFSCSQIGRAKNNLSFMFVRWYDIVSDNDILTEFGCTGLKITDQYDVLPLGSALGRVYVVQNFKVPGQFHVSSFKWDRSPVALAADHVDAFGN
eukprot:gene7140-biopygen16957